MGQSMSSQGMSAASVGSADNDPQVKQSGAPLLEVTGLTKRFGGIAAVNNVSFNLHAGRIVGLIGPNGAGKTTLVNLITGVQKASSGSLRFAGEEVTKQAPHESALRGLSRTFQIVQPFARMSVLDNVAAGALFAGRASKPMSICALLA